MTDIKKSAVAALLSGLLSAPVSADMYINIIDPPRQEAINIAGGITIMSSVDYEDGNYEDEIERKSFAGSVMYGISDGAGVFAGGAFLFDGEDSDNLDVEGNNFLFGAYSSVELSEGMETIVYGQYQIFKEEIKNGVDIDIDGSEISMGLVGVFGQNPELKLYAGPEFVFSSEFELEHAGRDYELEREDTFGFRAGFSKTMKNNDIRLFGTVGLMHEQTFFVGISKRVQ